MIWQTILGWILILEAFVLGMSGMFYMIEGEPFWEVFKWANAFFLGLGVVLGIFSLGLWLVGAI